MFSTYVFADRASGAVMLSTCKTEVMATNIQRRSRPSWIFIEAGFEAPTRGASHRAARQKWPENVVYKEEEKKMQITTTENSHLDHGLNPEQLAFVLAALNDGTATMKVGPYGTFFIAEVTLSEALGTVPCALHGPLTGEPPVTEEEVYYAPRGNRTYNSRMCHRPTAQSRIVTCICSDGVLDTAFGGPLTPKELGDPTMDDAMRPEAIKVWHEHALSLIDS